MISPRIASKLSLDRIDRYRREAELDARAKAGRKSSSEPSVHASANPPVRWSAFQRHHQHGQPG